MMKMFCILTVSMSISWLCHWIIVLQDVTTEENWVKNKIFSLYYSLQLHVHQQLSQNKIFNLKSYPGRFSKMLMIESINMW